MRRDEHAASPLVVLSTAVLVAVALTAVVLLVFFNDPEPDVELQLREGPALEVVQAAGAIAWEDLDVRLVDRGGFEHRVLRLPSGEVEEGQQVTFQGRPPAGDYLLTVTKGGAELERLVLSF